MLFFVHCTISYRARSGRFDVTRVGPAQGQNSQMWLLFAAATKVSD
jgi:hypothetical protein